MPCRARTALTGSPMPFLALISNVLSRRGGHYAAGLARPPARRRRRASPHRGAIEGPPTPGQHASFLSAASIDARDADGIRRRSTWTPSACRRSRFDWRHRRAASRATRNERAGTRLASINKCSRFSRRGRWLAFRIERERSASTERGAHQFALAAAGQALPQPAADAGEHGHRANVGHA